MQKLIRLYSCEEAFVIALAQCKSNEDILNAVKEIDVTDVCANNMSMYDDFIKKYSDLKYCYGCQSYHSLKQIEVIDGYCKKPMKIDKRFHGDLERNTKNCDGAQHDFRL